MNPFKIHAKYSGICYNARAYPNGIQFHFSLLRKLFFILGLNLPLLLANGCRDKQDNGESSAANPPADRIVQNSKRPSEEEVIKSAKRYIQIFFQRCEQVDMSLAGESEKYYFTEGISKPHAMFDEASQRWFVSFSNGMTGSSIDIEMSEDATRGCLSSANRDIPEVPSVGAETRAPLVGINEFSEAVNRIVLPRP